MSTYIFVNNRGIIEVGRCAYFNKTDKETGKQTEIQFPIFNSQFFPSRGSAGAEINFQFSMTQLFKNTSCHPGTESPNGRFNIQDPLQYFIVWKLKTGNLYFVFCSSLGFFVKKKPKFFVLK